MSFFNPCQPNQLVQQISNPGRRGVTTGRCRESGTRTFAQVEFGAQERDYIACDDLEPIRLREEGINELLEALKFGTKGDLARILTFHKISSNLVSCLRAYLTREGSRPGNLVAILRNLRS